MKGSFFRVLVALLPVMVVLAVLLGVARYGSADGLKRRVETEITARLPHPEFVPTPLPFDEAAYAPVAHAPAARPANTLLRPLIATTMPDIWAPKLPSTPAPLAVQPTSPVLASAQSLPARPVVPTITPSPTRQAPAQPTATRGSPAAGQSSARLSEITHIWQTFNNCGPATLAMNLSRFGQKVSQEEVAKLLRPNPDDKNVSLEEMAAYARTRGLSASVRVNGDTERLHRLLTAGAPVIIETWHEPKPNDGMGHYRLLVGFDDVTSQWVAYDSYDARDLVKGQPYTGIRLPYDETDRLWAAFNRQYMVIYDAVRAQAVERILAEDRDEVTLWTRALARAQADVQARPDDAFAWFNMGSDLVALGRFKEAAQAYDRARRIGLPWRMLWYQFGPFWAYYETGRYAEVIALANATINTAKQIEEAYFWRGLAEHAQGNDAAARASWQKAIELNPNYADPVAALGTLQK